MLLEALRSELRNLLFRMHGQRVMMRMLQRMQRLLGRVVRVVMVMMPIQICTRWLIRTIQVLSGLDHLVNIMIGCFVCSEW